MATQKLDMAKASRLTEILDNPVFICGHRKGGTTVLLCLLDNHPQLLTYPADSAFFYRIFPHCESLPKEAVIDRLARETIIANLSSEMSVVNRPDLFDVHAIAETYRTIMRDNDNTAAAHLRALMSAYAVQCGQDSRHWRRWVEKTTSTEIYAVEVAQWFPNAKFIHIVRDPRDNFGSLKSGWEARYKAQESDKRALLQSLLDRGGLGLRMAPMNLEALGPDRYLVVRFEDLAKDSDTYMRNIAKFIGIDFGPTLKVPTVNGVPWPGNNFDGVVFQGLSDANVGRWHERIERWEAAVIEGHLGCVMERLGYTLNTSASERCRACAEHYKWFNFLPADLRRNA
jgi:hypothetical protein